MKRTALLACVALLAGGCGSGRETQTSSGGEIRWIDVDARTNRFNGSFLAYFPSRVTVRPGDRVVFRSVWNGEPHTVTMGTLVDKALQGSPASDATGLPRWTLGQSAFLPANVGRPCYLTVERPPRDARQSCAVLPKQPAFNGHQSYHSSGFLPEDARFSVDIAPETKPGTYRFFCSFHGPKMSGSIKVVAKGSDIPPQADVDGARKERLAKLVDGTLGPHGKTYEPYEDARSGQFPWPALASFESHNGTVKVLEFVPYTLKAKVNERVRWSVLGAHTIAFDAPENAKPPAVRILSTGETELKADAVNENRSPEPPNGAPEEKVVVEAPRYSDGFLSSGMLYSPRRRLITFVVRFADPGSYRYQCLLHPKMTGLVTVSI